jgi:hypothetical protein
MTIASGVSRRLVFDAAAGTVAYRCNVDERDFAMPIRVGTRENWQTIVPTIDWKLMPTSLQKEQFDVATTFTT